MHTHLGYIGVYGGTSRKMGVGREWLQTAMGVGGVGVESHFVH